MKVKTISRLEEDYTRERSQDVMKVHRNLDPALHQMQRAHEYTRALNAVKLEKVFSQPFLAALGGHSDGLYCLARNPRSLNSMVSGAADGEVRLWDLPSRRTLRRLLGHTRAVRGLAVAADGRHAVSCSDDASVKIWQLPTAAMGELSAGDAAPAEQAAVATYYGKFSFRDVDHHWHNATFVTAGSSVDIWDHERSEPINSFTWGSDTVVSVRFNPVEQDIFASCGSDRSIALYDVRMQTPLRKLVMLRRSNKVAWNPQEAFNFTVANEDNNLYSYDMRKLQSATTVHKDFTSAVMDVDYSPTGREFVAGSYDRTVRIFPFNGGHSREVYHTKRMQRVFAVQFSGDGTYVFSGSEDMNVRIWKANAAQQLGTMLPREWKKAQYNAALIDRFKHVPDIKRISRHRHVPKQIMKASELRRTMENSERRKKDNRVKHSAPGKVKHVAARKERIVSELE